MNVQREKNRRTMLPGKVLVKYIINVTTGYGATNQKEGVYVLYFIINNVIPSLSVQIKESPSASHNNPFC